MGITTTSLLSAPVQASFAMRLLSVPVPYMIHSLCAEQKTMPKNGGTIFRQRRYNPLGTAEVPLGNSGLTPPPQLLSALNVDCAMSFYGSYVMINEQVTLQAQDAPLNEATRRLGVSAKQTEDVLLRQALESSLVSINATSGVNGDLPTEVNTTDLQGVYKTLMKASAKPFLSGIQGENRFGSSPTREAFVALAHSELIGQLDACQGFISKWNYPNQNTTMDEEYCSIANTRFMLSPIGSVTANASMLGNDVYNIFIMGQEAFASVKMDQYSMQFIYLPPQYSGPLALNCSAGYRFSHASVIQNDSWLAKFRVTLA